MLSLAFLADVEAFSSARVKLRAVLVKAESLEPL